MGAGGAMGTAAVVEVVNALVLAFVVSEVTGKHARRDAVEVLRRREVGLALGVAALLNLALHLGRPTLVVWEGWVWERVEHTHSFVGVLELALVLPFGLAVMVGAAYLKLRSRTGAEGGWQAITALRRLIPQNTVRIVGAFAVGTAVTFLLVMQVDVAHWVPRGEPFKVLAVCAVFATACFFDVRRTHQQLTVDTFILEVVVQTMTLPSVFLFLALAIAIVMVVAVAVLELVHIDPHVLNSTIYYSILYGPLGWVYRAVKLALMRGSHLPL